MARRSLASLAVAAVSIDGRPNPPAELTKAQAAAWTQIVLTETAGLFKTEASKELLVQYVRHLDAASLLASSIDSFELDWLTTAEGLERYDRLLKVREREVRASLSVATKLRITPQSRYTAKAAGTAASHVGGANKPWNYVGFGEGEAGA